MPDKFKAGARQRLPDRRRSEARRIVWQPPHNPDAPETRIFVTIGFGEDGLRPVEIFYDGGYRAGSELEALVKELCIVLSVIIQHEDVEIARLAHSLGREQSLRSDREDFISLVGVLIGELLKPPMWSYALMALKKEGDKG